MKVCTTCRVMKPLTDYRDNKRGGPRAQCRDCGNVDRARYKSLKAKPVTTKQAVLDAKKEYYRRRRAIEKLRSGKVKGDGPCWVCRNQAMGSTPYRLCAICAG